MQRLAEIRFRIALGNRKAIRASVDVEERRIIYVRFLELDGARSYRRAAGWALPVGDGCVEGFGNARHVRYSVKQDFGVQRPRQRMRIVDLVFLVGRIRTLG